VDECSVTPSAMFAKVVVVYITVCPSQLSFEALFYTQPVLD
jgi:hypothetical protein